MKLRFLTILPFVLLTSCTVIDGYKYDAEGFVELDGQNLTLDDINSVTVDWVNGSVYFEQSDADYLSLRESITDYPLYYKVDNGALTIRLTKSGMPSRIVNKMDKALTVYLPESIDYLKVDTVDTFVGVYMEVHLDKAEFNTVNGYVGTQTYKARNTKISSVGTSYSFSRLISYENERNSFNISAVNSDVNMGFKKDDGFDVRWNATQSTFTNDINNQYVHSVLLEAYKRQNKLPELLDIYANFLQNNPYNVAFQNGLKAAQALYDKIQSSNAAQAKIEAQAVMDRMTSATTNNMENFESQQQSTLSSGEIACPNCGKGNPQNGYQCQYCGENLIE